MTSSVSVLGSCLVAASDLAMNGSSGRPGWVLARRRCCHFCCHALAGRRWVMSQTTFVSAVSGSLQSPRWPGQTCCVQSPQAFCVSPVSACPATSRAQMRAQIGLPACWFVSASVTVRSGIQRPREHLIRRSVPHVRAVRCNPYPQVRVHRVSDMDAPGPVLSNQSVRKR